jgi:hypothetical protein
MMKKQPGRCECKQNRTVIEIVHWEHCPLEGGVHTEFHLHRCEECGKVCGFPDMNLSIAMEDGTPETKAKLREIMGQS